LLLNDDSYDEEDVSDQGDVSLRDVDDQQILRTSHWLLNIQRQQDNT
jgi:hypothetical protein